MLQVENKPIPIRVLKAKDNLLWYNQMVGKVYFAYREYEDSYLVRTDTEYSNIIYKCDCQLMKEKEKHE